MAKAPATLVIGPSWIGDMVMAQCLLKALKEKHPDRPIDVMSPRSTADIVRRMPEARAWLDAPFDRGALRLGARTAAGRAILGRYDQAYVLPGSWKSALVPFFARIGRRTGFLREWRYGLLNDIRPLPDRLKRRTAAAYQSLAGPGDLAPPRLSIDRDAQQRLLGRHGLVEQRFVALFPGAEYGPAKRWPSEHYGAIARTLADAHGLISVVFGSPRDREVGDEIAALAPSTLNLCGETTLGEAIDLVAASRVAVTNDSGLMHVAAAVGVPVVAIYGSTTPGNTPPLTERAEMLTLSLDCSPCHQRTCRFGHTNCLKQLMPAAVMQAVRRLGAI